MDLKVAKVLAALVLAEFAPERGSSSGEGTRRECSSSWGLVS